MFCRSGSSRLFFSSIVAGFLLVTPAEAYAPVEASSPQASSSAARPLPRPEDFANPADRALINELLSKTASASDAKEALPALDEMLANLREPTPLRGLFQFFRATALSDEQLPEALEAAEESIRLLPGYSAPLIQAASLYAYSNEPAKGGDYFLRAIQIDPETVRHVEDYEVNNIMRRLIFARDERRSRAIGDALIEIGWIGDNLDSRSSLPHRHRTATGRWRSGRRAEACHKANCSEAFVRLASGQGIRCDLAGR